MKVSVIIAYYGNDPTREELLSKLIGYIQRQHYDRKEVEIILVRDKLSQVTAEKTIVLPQVIPFNKCWHLNVGAKMASGEWLYFIDADFMFENDYFKRLEEYRNGKVCFSGLSTFVRQEKQALTPPLEHKLDDIYEQIFNRSIPAGRYFQELMDYFPAFSSKDYSQLCIAGGVLCFERAFFWSTGGYNENFFGYGGEDGEMEHRVTAMQNKELDYMPGYTFHPWHTRPVGVIDHVYYAENVKMQEAVLLGNKNLVIDRMKRRGVGNMMAPTTFKMRDIWNAAQKAVPVPEEGDV